MRSVERIAFVGRLEPERPAVIAGNSIVTFGMLEGAVCGVAAKLRDFHLDPGSFIGVSVKAPARHLAISLALIRMGLCSVPFDNEAGLANLPELVLAIADQPFAMPGGRLCLVAGDDWFVPGSASTPPTSFPGLVRCRVTLSSGTTGQPKPLLLSRDAMEARIYGAEPQLSIGGMWSRGLLMMDLSSSWGFVHALAPLSNGRTICFAANPVDALRMVSLYGCEYLMGSVFQLRELVAAQRRNFVPVPSLRGVRVGGSAIGSTLVADTRKLLARQLVLSYGSTEIGISAIVLVNGDEFVEGMAGIVHPDVDVEVVDQQGTLSAGEGRIRIRSDHPATQIDGSPLSSDGWFYPGDIGRLDAERLYVTGRESELINVGGGKVAPESVEAMLLLYPSVKDAGVVGVRDPRGGDAIVAAVVGDAQLDLAELARFAADNFLPAPLSRIIQVAAIPRGETGKVRRQELLKQLAL